MHRRELFEIIEDQILDKGGSDIILDTNRKHPRIYFSYRGITKFLVMSNTPSDPRTPENAKRQVNELFAYITDITPNYVEEEEEAPRIRTSTPFEVPQTFGERLQFAREQQQLSRERLSDLSGIDENLIQRYEVTKQESLKDFTTALLLSSALNLSLAYLVGEDMAKEFKPMTTLGEAISRRRKDGNMSLGELAGRSSLSLQQLANIETGLYHPNATKIDDIARALGVRKRELTEETEEEVTVEVPSPVPEPTVTSPPGHVIPPGMYEGIGTLKEFALFLRYLRERKGMTQSELGPKIGTYSSEISKAERGIWAGSLMLRHQALADALEFPQLKSVMDRVQESVGRTPRSAPLGYKRQPPRVTEMQPKPVEEVPVEPRVVEAERIEAAPAKEPVETVMLSNILIAIQAEASQTRALMRQQHEELISAIRSSNTADTLHNFVDLIFGKRS